MKETVNRLLKEIKDTVRVYKAVLSPNKKIIKGRSRWEEEDQKKYEDESDAIKLSSFGKPYQIKESVQNVPVNLRITSMEAEEIQFDRAGYPQHATVLGHEYHLVLSDGLGNVINEKFSPQGKFRGWKNTATDKTFQASNGIYLCVFDVVENRTRAEGRSAIVKYTP